MVKATPCFVILSLRSTSGMREGSRTLRAAEWKETRLATNQRGLYRLESDTRDVEDVGCEFCAQSDIRPIGTDNGWTLVRCGSCGHVFISPRMKPAPVAEYYRKHEWAPPEAEQSAEWHFWIERTRLIRLSAIIRAVSPPAEVLELGCGPGDILATLREHGYRVRGIELDQMAAARALRVLGADCVSTDPIEHCGDSGRFDAVVMFSVLEHTSRPLAFMKEVNRVLKPGGKTIIHVPNLTFLRLRQRLGRATDWGAPAHLHFFSLRTLSELLHRSGFRIIAQFWAVHVFVPASRGLLLRARVAVSTGVNHIIWEATGPRLSLGHTLDVVAEKRARH
jgi:SAM-dependent methyltransferase